MKIIHTKAFVLIMIILVSILVTLLPPNVVAFAVQAQTPGIPFSSMHGAGTDARQVIKQGVSLPGAFNGHKRASNTALLVTALPGIGQFAAAAFLPTCLGLWRTGYAVS